jgi:NAD-dependent dihydropyrimidine dehydrogenase PreA subunit
MSISINADACTACETCIETCPLDLIEMSNDVATINDTDSCIECAACVDACAFEAISL